MGFKQSPFPMISGTKGHSSALKKASAVKKTDWAAMHEKAKKTEVGKDDQRYTKMTQDEYKNEPLIQANQKKQHKTWDVSGEETKKREAKKKADADADAAKKKAAADAAAAKETERKAVKTEGLGKKKGKTLTVGEKENEAKKLIEGIPK